ncbi:helix-turn-helix transcriptional regulator [Mucilaginibacter sp.]|uniref:helix-turn-helix domain-containing protein n=1 Tax=Mucilaginibacter sp. TaxID=1882438 RepID=UPI0025EE96D9|nr:helix-turn-helix transcriptional regulator [Mucilaginibacter sp.]
MDQNEIIGANLRRFREKLNLTQENLATYLDISRVEVNYYENGKRNMPSGVLAKAAKLFGIDEYDLYEEAADNAQANVAFAFRADFLNEADLNHIADFRKIVMNYLKMKKHIANG